MSVGGALRVFFSYSHKDGELRDRLDTHLALLKRLAVIETWSDNGITAGQEFAPEIFQQLDNAHVILLLISPDFIASNFCWSQEMLRAMARHEAGEARVIPVLLRPVDNWQSAPFGKLKTLPKDGLAATEWPDLDRAFRDVAAGIRVAVEQLAAQRSGAGAAHAAPARPLRVVFLIGHSVASPLPEAVAMAQAAVLDFQQAGLQVALRVDQATTANFEREAAAGADLFLFYGHGTSDGQLSFVDGAKSWADLSGLAGASFWQNLSAAFLFACDGERFAAQLPGPWVAFAEPIPTEAPKGFLHALIHRLSETDFAAAVAQARALCEGEMRSTFPDAMRFSALPLPAIRVANGNARLERASPALTKNHRLDFGTLQSADLPYPDDDPFVGRVGDLESLLRLPSPYDDRPTRRVVWVHGDAGIGKSALLRQFAIFVRDLAFREAAEPVHLLHLYCYRFTRVEEVLQYLCTRAAELYRLDSPPAAIEALYDQLETRCGTRGTHVWILDDLTYLSVQPDSTAEAQRLVGTLRDLAAGHGLRLQLVVSSRRPAPSAFESLAVGPLEQKAALALAVGAWQARPTGAGRERPEELVLGAAQIFHLVQSTGQYKRALLLAIERGMTYRAYAESLRAADSLDAQEQLEETQGRLRFEVRQLAALGEKHGFAYGAFLGIYYRLIARAATFTQAELEGWFEDRFVVAGAPARKRAYAYGLSYLRRLGFAFIEDREGEQVFSLPPQPALVDACSQRRSGRAARGRTAAGRAPATLLGARRSAEREPRRLRRSPQHGRGLRERPRRPVLRRRRLLLHVGPGGALAEQSGG